MTRLEAIKRLEWLAMVGKHVDSVTIGGDDMECLEMAIAILREQDAKYTNDFTNADHIRSMTDEELAKFILQSPCDKVRHDDFDCYGACEGCVSIWLKQPYKE